MTINWPDIKFPPVNLYSVPKQWVEVYEDLETQYCSDIKEQYEEEKGTMFKEVLRLEFEYKREEFNRLWNARAGG